MIRNTKTKIFLDSADPLDTIEAIKILGQLDGQTTNPSLFAKTVDHKFSADKLWEEYHKTLIAIRKLIPKGSISAEIYADTSCTLNQLLSQAQRLEEYDLNLHIKVPIFKTGIVTLGEMIEKNMKVNMTLGFDQNQAYAVAMKSRGCDEGQVFFSAFVGRSFDNGIDGVANIFNIMRMYEEMNTKVQVLACSFRTLDQFLACLSLDVDIVTVSLDILEQWEKHEFKIPPFSSFSFKEPKPKYLTLDHLDSEIVNNPLSLAGINKFATDWNSLIN